ncbi:TetR/AcrR family transcriptional regulator [Frankia sp. CNm7]|uniref:TetR/AcrR family transcriptional regulator n=1 Tax=Frankia nepalensis TaxID=1836974 RepID=A0A937RE31_9ACTN|nr:TetR/AcrR family transcriptional regulator [Frankia nepalensis]MBL7502439.1 TetR/AcrR family transcriptional regulator [Frankia nepalensis]MBL7516302.1 TetR/AcrR family transcriptional regulator [Frankia nepalensis]MBL7519608.1 TetR/AcrR family transcriptional regulator [Frankia nepalensis]MBL7625749.1 TetR/AcrR family transcriptional regulator [Frankia nepalensis]
MDWAERVVDRSLVLHRTRSRSIQQTKIIVDAAKRLIVGQGGNFTTHLLVKEAGVSMKTFYLHFAGKDQLLVAVVEDLITEAAMRYEEAARDLPDPVARLRHHVMAVQSSLAPDADDLAIARFVASEHWRLRQLLPEEMMYANRPYVELLAREIRAAQEAGMLPVADVDRDAKMIARIVMSAFHHYAFPAPEDPEEGMDEYLWEFCLGALRRSADV